MGCNRCGIINPDPVDTWETEDGPAIPAYWFLVTNDQPVEAAGIEAGGDIAFRFKVWTMLEHPIPGEDEEVLCGECFAAELHEGEDE